MSALYYLLCAFATLGTVDIVYFHLYRYRLFSRAASRGEQIAHIFRLLLFLLILGWVMFVRAGGPYALILPALLSLDLLNSLADVAMEPDSRADLDGLPPGEYFVHMVAMAVWGASAVLALQHSLQAFRAAPELTWHRLDLPIAHLGMGASILLGTLALLAVETIGLLWSLRRRR